MIEYKKAQEEWAFRIGAAKSQARYWQIACFFSFLIVIFLIVALVTLIHTQKTYVYVAEVKPQENMVNVKPAEVPYVPSQAQEAFFIGKFIHSIMTLPLDPVVVRDQWLSAYQWVDGQAVDQLNRYAQKNNPLTAVGRMTQIINIKSYHPIGNHSFEFSWTQTTYDTKSHSTHTDLYNGIFTLAQAETPSNTHLLLENPLGFKIIYFTFSLQGDASSKGKSHE